MKVILLQDVRKVGKKFEVKEVSDGYALNFLIPRKLAEVSTASSMKKVETVKAHADAERKIQEDLLVKNLKSLEGVTLHIKANANDKGHLFKGINKEELVKALKAETQIDLLPEYLDLEKPLKEVGEFTIPVKVQATEGKFKVEIAAE
jgi:large subunit ribosomal protein L9